jgi:hypothetical protein
MKGFKSVLKHKILIKLYVLNWALIYYVYGDTIQAKVAVLCLLVALYVLHNTSFKEHLPDDGHNRWRKHVGHYVLIQQIYIFVYALVGFVPHFESSQHGHESLKIVRLCERRTILNARPVTSSPVDVIRVLPLNMPSSPSCMTTLICDLLLHRSKYCNPNNDVI